VKDVPEICSNFPTLEKSLVEPMAGKIGINSSDLWTKPKGWEETALSLAFNRFWVLRQPLPTPCLSLPSDSYKIPQTSQSTHGAEAILFDRLALLPRAADEPNSNF